MEDTLFEIAYNFMCSVCECDSEKGVMLECVEADDEIIICASCVERMRLDLKNEE